MKTCILSIEQPSSLAIALQHLNADDAIVAPTDTVYGVMCRFDRPQAIDSLYEIKGRPPEKAIPVLISDLHQLTQLTHAPVSPVAQALAAQFWPGPLTIVLPALPTLPSVLTAQQPTVGVRLPAHGWLRTLIRQSGPLAATSANLSGQPEAHTVDEILTQLGGRLALILADAHLDQREQTASQPSTVVAVESTDPMQPTVQPTVRILRAGFIAQEVQQFLQERFSLPC